MSGALAVVLAPRPELSAALQAWTPAQEPGNRREETTWRRVTLADGTHVFPPLPRRLATQYVRPLITANGYMARCGPLLYVAASHSTAKTPTPLADLAAALRAHFAALPEAEQGSDLDSFLTALRGFSRLAAESHTRAYFGEVARHLRTYAWRHGPLAPKRSKPKPDNPRAGMSPAEAARSYREERRRRDVEASASYARYWLACARRDKTRRPEDAVAATEIWEAAHAFLEECADLKEPIPGSRIVPRSLPGRTAFYAGADTVLGPRSRASSGMIYRLPERLRPIRTD